MDITDVNNLSVVCKSINSIVQTILLSSVRLINTCTLDKAFLKQETLGTCAVQSWAERLGLQVV